MPPSKTFEFLDLALPVDGDLHLILAERVPVESSRWGVPAYTFKMRLASGEFVGRIHLRVGWNENVIRYAGHIGYAVEAAHRGRRYAERVCRVIVPLAKQHRMPALWITCQPDNAASRRTLERIGGEYIGVLDVPPEYPLDAGAERKKMCFRLKLE
jgi:predicted acetyltransferase